MSITHELDQGIAEVVVDRPPVNALDVKSWFELAAMVRRLGARSDVRVLILRAEGRGFNGNFQSLLEKEGGRWMLDRLDIVVPPDKISKSTSKP